LANGRIADLPTLVHANIDPKIRQSVTSMSEAKSKHGSNSTQENISASRLLQPTTYNTWICHLQKTPTTEFTTPMTVAVKILLKFWC